MASEAGDSPLAERRLTEHLGKFFASDDPGVVLGIGDDAAVVRTTPRTVVACDPVVEGVHFAAGDPLAKVGRKAVNRNLSDLAAMGASPTYLLVSLLVPEWLDPAGRDELFEGIRRAARRGACTVVGGDVARTPGPLVVTVTAMGTAPRRPLRRDTLAVGDTLHVTGRLGGSRRGGHLDFVPRLAQGQWLAEHKVVSACIDVSDGLLVDLQTMLTASGGLGAVLEASRIPVATAARRSAKLSGHDPLFHALQDGEDHELLFGLNGPLAVGGPLTGRARRSIGLVTATAGIYLRGHDGVCRRVEPLGYQHDV